MNDSDELLSGAVVYISDMPEQMQDFLKKLETDARAGKDYSELLSRVKAAFATAEPSCGLEYSVARDICVRVGISQGHILNFDGTVEEVEDKQLLLDIKKELASISARIDELTDLIKAPLDAKTGFLSFKSKCFKEGLIVNTFNDVNPELLETLLSYRHVGLALDAAHIMNDRHWVFEIIVGETKTYNCIEGKIVDSNGSVIDESNIHLWSLPNNICAIAPIAQRYHRLVINGFVVSTWTRTGYEDKGINYCAKPDGPDYVVQSILDIFGLKDKQFPVP